MKFGLLAMTLAIFLIAGPAFAGPATDSDSDGTVDLLDQCSSDATSPSPCGVDADSDGYGNACDGDYNNDGVVNATDVAPFVADLTAGFDSGIGSDANCDGVVNATDVGPFVAQLTAGSPGPSGLTCAGTIPCP